MRWLSPLTHGIIDYLACGLFALAPLWFMIDERTPAVMGCYVAALVLLVVSMLTRYPLGVAKIIPFRLHGALEFFASPLLLAYPWIAGFDHLYGPRTFFVAAGAALFVVWAITDYRAADPVEAVATGRPRRPAMHQI